MRSERDLGPRPLRRALGAGQVLYLAAESGAGFSQQAQGSIRQFSGNAVISIIVTWPSTDPNPPGAVTLKYKESLLASCDVGFYQLQTSIVGPCSGSAFVQSSLGDLTNNVGPVSTAWPPTA